MYRAAPGGPMTPVQTPQEAANDAAECRHPNQPPNHDGRLSLLTSRRLRARLSPRRALSLLRLHLSCHCGLFILPLLSILYDHLSPGHLNAAARTCLSFPPRPYTSRRVGPPPGRIIRSNWRVGRTTPQRRVIQWRPLLIC